MTVSCYTLSRLKGIETSVTVGPTALPASACYTLSRLKGIETLQTISDPANLSFLAIHFPVWRELKLILFMSAGLVVCACYTLSRLKGIETWRCWLRQDTFKRKLAIHFPVWRELKLNSLVFCSMSGSLLAIHFPVWRELKHNKEKTFHYFSLISCYTLSRLKGIETFVCLAGCAAAAIFLNLLYTFPFEGNWNTLNSLPLSFSSVRLAIHFPVWRELKQCPSLPLFGPASLLYTFPFEGNWNLLPRFQCFRQWQLAIHFPVWRELKRVSWKTLCRRCEDHLAIHFPVWRELKLSQYETAWSNHCLAIHFPVWRELKLSSKRSSGTAKFSLAIHFPVWRELKLILNYISQS